MKKYVISIALIIIALAILIPFASSNPDGLEKVAETFGANEQEPFWQGFMADYQVAFSDNPYLSTLLAGIIGVFAVLLVALLFGKIVIRK